MKKNLLTISILLLIVLSGCVTANIAANKAPWYKKELSRVYVFFNVTSEATKFSHELSKEIISEFRNNNIEGIYEIRNPLALETEKDLEDNIGKYNPDQTMTFNQTSLHSTNGIIQGGVFDISIVDEETKKVIWKGVLDVYSEMGIEDSIKKSISKLSEKLKQDALM